MTKLTSTAFWRDILARAIRNSIQVLLPVLVLASSGQIDGLTIRNAIGAAVLSGVVVVLKALSPLNASPTDPLGWQLVERAVGAFAGAALAIIPLDLTSLLSLDARTVAISIAGSVLLSFAAFYTNPPAIPATQLEDGTFVITGVDGGPGA